MDGPENIAEISRTLRTGLWENIECEKYLLTKAHQWDDIIKVGHIRNNIYSKDSETAAKDDPRGKTHLNLSSTLPNSVNYSGSTARTDNVNHC